MTTTTTAPTAPKIPAKTKTLETKLKAKVKELLKAEDDNRVAENYIALGCVAWMDTMTKVFPTSTEESLRTLLKNALGVHGKRICGWINGGRCIQEYSLDPKVVNLPAAVFLKNMEENCTKTSFERGWEACIAGDTQADMAHLVLLKPAAVKRKIRQRVNNLNLTSKTKFNTSLEAHMEYGKKLYGEGCKVTVTDARGEVVFSV